jgi:hypothetical protein
MSDPGDDEIRAEFERQHQGRNLTRHRLRGTYISVQIAAIWNQHVRSVAWQTARAQPVLRGVMSDAEIAEIGHQSGIGALTSMLDDDQWNNIEPRLLKFARAILAAQIDMPEGPTP